MIYLVGPMASKLPVVSKYDVTGRLIGVFKNLISEGTLTPGGRLPAERDLADTFGVSRSSLRQALKVLETMGVISQRVGDGTYLNAGAPSILSESMEFLILLDGISFYELMEARLIVEPELVARAAIRATADDMLALSTVHASMELSKNDSRSFVEADLLFHQTLFRISGNRVCSVMFTVVHQSVHKLMALTAALVDPEHTLMLHRRIITAIRKGDANEARRRMVEHLQDATGLLAKTAAKQTETRLLTRLSKLAAQMDDR